MAFRDVLSTGAVCTAGLASAAAYTSISVVRFEPHPGPATIGFQPRTVPVVTGFAVEVGPTSRVL